MFRPLLDALGGATANLVGGVTPDTDKILDGLIDILAAVEHQRWAHWQNYVQNKAIANSDGSLTIPPELVNQWGR